MRYTWKIRELSIHPITSSIVYEIWKKLNIPRPFLEKVTNSS